MDNLLSPVTVIQSSGIILHILSMKVEMEFAELHSISGLDSENFYMSIGYLVKEDRVIFYYDGDRLKIKLIGRNYSN